jgi:predicted transcriptional regulator
VGIYSPVKRENMNFGEKIKFVCEKEGINLKEFSKLANIPYDSIKRYARGENQPPHNRVKQISEVTNFAKYRNMLLSIEEPIETIGEDPEVLELIRQ